MDQRDVQHGWLLIMLPPTCDGMVDICLLSCRDGAVNLNNELVPSAATASPGHQHDRQPDRQWQ